MSNIIDAVKEGAEEAKNAILNRFSAPFAAYAATSWLAFNWSNIAYFFMSEHPVETRINAIYAQDYLYIHYLILPIITGFFLSIIMPAFNALITSITAGFAARSDNAHQAAVDKIQIINLNKKKIKQKIESDIKSIKKQADALTDEISLLNSRKANLSNILLNHDRKILAFVLRYNLFINSISSLMPTDELTDEVTINIRHISNFFTNEERLAAQEWREEMYAILNNQKVDEVIKKFISGNDITPETLKDVILNLNENIRMCELHEPS